MLACKGFKLAKGKGTPTSLNPICSRKLITCTSSLPESRALHSVAQPGPPQPACHACTLAYRQPVSQYDRKEKKRLRLSA